MKGTLVISLTALLSLAATAQTRTIATQTLQLQVQSIAALALSGDPAPLLITTGAAGGNALSPAREHSTSYRLTTNTADMKLSVAIDRPVPSGTRLFIELGPGSGVSAGKIDISQALSPLDAVTSIKKGWVQDQPITYTFEADADRESFAPENRSVILTLTN